jgi:hypothetical protein
MLYALYINYNPHWDLFHSSARLIINKDISSCQVLRNGWVDQFPNDNIAVVGLYHATL